VVVEHTGPSEVLDGGAGILRFSSATEAMDALADVVDRYEVHRDAARSLVEEHFDAVKVLDGLLGSLCAPVVAAGRGPVIPGSAG
jgi:hypothetical protein